MTNYLLGAILVVLILNGDWPIKARAYVKVTWQRLKHAAQKRRRNRRAKRAKRASDSV